jgi:hypothetical protein
MPYLKEAYMLLVSRIKGVSTAINRITLDIPYRVFYNLYYTTFDKTTNTHSYLLRTIDVCFGVRVFLVSRC